MWLVLSTFALFSLHYLTQLVTTRQVPRLSPSGPYRRFPIGSGFIYSFLQWDLYACPVGVRDPVYI